MEEKRLRSENVGLDGVFDDDDDGSVTLMEILKDKVTFRVKKPFKANVLNNLGARALIGIVCTSYDTMIKFMKIYIAMYFTSLEDKDHTSDVIVYIYDDVIKDENLKKDFFLFMKETKIQHEVDIINKKRLHSKSKSISVSDPIVHSKINSSSKQNNISDLTSLICDSTIQTSTIPDLRPPILTPTNQTMSNFAHIKEKNVICVVICIKYPTHWLEKDRIL